MQDEVILNRFKRLMHSGAGSEADGRMARTGRVRSKTLQKARELAESIIEDEVRNLTITDEVRDLVRNVAISRRGLLNELRIQGIVGLSFRFNSEGLHLDSVVNDNVVDTVGAGDGTAIALIRILYKDKELGQISEFSQEDINLH